MTIVRAAVVQAAPVAFDRERTLEQVRALAAEAAGTGARLIVFPEAFVSGYPRGLDFGARVGSRTPEGRERFRRYWDSAVDVPGPATEALGDAARGPRAHLVVGVVERDGGTLYCSVLFFAPDGAPAGQAPQADADRRRAAGLGLRRRLDAARRSTRRSAGSGRRSAGRTTCRCCGCTCTPRGCSSYCAPTADDRETWLATMRHIALEGRCFVLSCNQFARRSDYPADYPGGPGGRPGDGHVARGQLHRRPAGPGPGRAAVRRPEAS